MIDGQADSAVPIVDRCSLDQGADVEKGAGDLEGLLKQLTGFVREMKAATRG